MHTLVGIPRAHSSLGAQQFPPCRHMRRAVPRYQANTNVGASYGAGPSLLTTSDARRCAHMARIGVSSQNYHLTASTCTLLGYQGTMISNINPQRGRCTALACYAQCFQGLEGRTAKVPGQLSIKPWSREEQEFNFSARFPFMEAVCLNCGMAVPPTRQAQILSRRRLPPLPAARASPDAAADPRSAFTLPPNSCFRRPTSTPAALGLLEHGRHLKLKERAHRALPSYIR
eukprot:1154081-Rhodomonas_salina.1